MLDLGYNSEENGELTRNSTYGGGGETSVIAPAMVKGGPGLLLARVTLYTQS
jgi:hypothetical protein